VPIRKGDRIIVNGLVMIRKRLKQTWVEVVKMDKLMLHVTKEMTLKKVEWLKVQWKRMIHIAHPKILG